MSVDELVEGVARAIAGHFGPAYDDLLPSRLEVRKSGEPNDNDQGGVREAARSAILAVLEGVATPTAAMHEAAHDALDSRQDYSGCDIYVTWHAMIDALRASVEKEDA